MIGVDGSARALTKQVESESSVDPIRAAGVDFAERWIAVDQGVELRVLEWQPRQAHGADPLVFVAGWVSVVEGWLPVLREMIPRRPVFYVETREKRSARIARGRLRVSEFTVERLAQDLIGVVRSLEIDTDRAVWFGSSMGSNAILEGFKNERLAGRGAFLIGPNAEFRFPWWGRPILYGPAWLYHPIKYFVIWYLRNFRVDAQSEPEQMLRYERTLRSAHPLRLKLSARAIVDYQACPGLDTIVVPVAIAYAASDVLHAEDEVRGIVAAIPRGTTVECPTNAYMHDARIVEDIERFIERLE
jgi:pimeloyl-ACP methyl ester carboxylesterase